MSVPGAGCDRFLNSGSGKAVRLRQTAPSLFSVRANAGVIGLTVTVTVAHVYEISGAVRCEMFGAIY
jgi:hypothetical protein